jgi:hypothetical protein
MQELFPKCAEKLSKKKGRFKVYTLWERIALRPNENAERQIFKAHKMSKINGGFFYETVFIQ